MSNSILVEKSFTFSLRIIDLYYEMIKSKEFTISTQILRSGTSIGANVRESRFAESSNDFVHKLKIAQKECNETLYWLELISSSNKLNYKIDSLHSDCTELLKIICSTIITCKRKK
nr:four helix bundle protein [Clostridium paraputrificum]